MVIHSDELRLLPEHEELFALSVAYVSSCIYLTKGMVKGVYLPTFANSRVILNNCHHGYELFFKASLISKGVKFTKIHNINDLEKLYKKHFYGAYHELPMLFSHGALDEYDSSERITAHFNLLHQRYRYSSDRKGQRWGGIEAFIPDMFLEELEELNEKMQIAWNSINESQSTT